jgi:hypothetical protein
MWVPNWSSMAVTCGTAGQWSWGIIVGRGDTTAVSDLPAGYGLGGGTLESIRNWVATRVGHSMPVALGNAMQCPDL